jgi:two-component system response regulator
MGIDSTDYPILLVEDNPDDVLITQRAWKIGSIKNKLYVVTDGEQALEFINKEGRFHGAPTPSLILLDLKMPRIDGFEVLTYLKGDERTKIIPVIVLTSSNRMDDVQKAYEIGCNNYIVKPISFEKFIDAVTAINTYWFSISKMPD